MSCVLVRGLGRRLTLGQRWDNEWFVPPPLVPRSGVRHFSRALLAQFRFVTSMYEREDRSRYDGYICTSDDLEQPKRVRELFVAPRVPAHHRDPKHLDLRRLDHHEKRLQVAPAGSSAVLVDNHLAPRLRPSHGTR